MTRIQEKVKRENIGGRKIQIGNGVVGMGIQRGKGRVNQNEMFMKEL